MDNLQNNLRDPDAFDLSKWEKELQARNLPGMKRVMPKGQKQSSMKDELVARAMAEIEKIAASSVRGDVVTYTKDGSTPPTLKAGKGRVTLGPSVWVQVVDSAGTRYQLGKKLSQHFKPLLKSLEKNEIEVELKKPNAPEPRKMTRFDSPDPDGGVGWTALVTIVG